jgi:hypothetical protein
LPSGNNFFKTGLGLHDKLANPSMQSSARSAKRDLLSEWSFHLFLFPFPTGVAIALER